MVQNEAYWVSNLPSLSLPVHICKWEKAHNGDTGTVGSRLDKTKLESLLYTSHENEFKMD